MSFIWLTTVASCVRPRSIRNGRVSGRDFGHGKTVSYRCDENYAILFKTYKKKFCIKMILLHSHLIHEKDANPKCSLFQP